MAATNAKYKKWLEPDGLELLASWARDGMIDDEIAEQIGIAVRTLARWKLKYPEIAKALSGGKAIVDARVEDSLLKRALGYEYDEVTKELQFDRETGEKRLVETKRVTKQVLPDVTAQIFWLKNRRPDMWRDKQALEVSGMEQEQSRLAELIEQRRKRRGET